VKEQKKWFQVTRFPALPTAGIHGAEHRNWKRRTLRFSATRNGSRFHEIHSGVKGPSLLLRFLARRFLRPFSPNLHNRPRFAPVPAASSVHARCAAYDSRAWLRLPLPLPFGILTSLRIKAFRGTCRPPTRLPIRPISIRSPQPFLFLGSATDHRSRSATFRRLAVPQTSWNLYKYAPGSLRGQRFSRRRRAFSSTFSMLSFH
jgi:hypothetical protein